MKEVLIRALTALFLSIVIITSVLGGQYIFLVLLMLLNILALFEFYSLLKYYYPEKLFGFILSTCLFLSGSLAISGVLDPEYLLINIPVAFVIFVSQLYKVKADHFQSLAFTFLGIIYISIPLLFLFLIAFLPAGAEKYHPLTVLGFVFIVWANDTGAYFIGKYFGKHKLFKRISPGKTWEGSIGGAIWVALTVFTLSLFSTGVEVVSWSVIAFIVVIIGTYGDLVKSLLKRNLGVKDSGTILPGHGGILDRFDSMLSSAPFVFMYLTLFNAK